MNETDYNRQKGAPNSTQSEKLQKSWHSTHDASLLEGDAFEHRIIFSRENRKL